ncbi:50S ribosomal protein L25/general stress protein Ctc [Peribacillus alkalitolerans]|uniref:50S ribosomal protein L25/general stress protein Ctc n=1 Tax=Peribacillus alkalitolerans TaxID=1550385 RepID=UPI0013D55E34|nr:50S ribosomal protein L25/general stress protein Ctc [Peribacillus alkalitolerans]
MGQAALAAQERTKSSRSSLRELRTKGHVPAVVYGSKKESKAISVDSLELTKTMREVGRNGIITLDVNGSSENVMLTDYQIDCLKNEFIHADFFIVDLNADITANVRINLTGDSAGVKDGGVMQQSLHELSITAKPNDIPESIDVDVSNLQVNEVVTVGDIKNQYKIDINHDETETIASILPPRQEEEINSGEQQDGGVPDHEEGRETPASEE